MKKNSTTIYFLVGIGIILLIALIYGLASQGEKEFSWRESYSNENKQPFGTFVLYELLNEIFTGDSIQIIEHAFFQEMVYDSLERTNYLFINSYFGADEADLDEMIRFAREGNYIFIAARGYSDIMEEKLGFTTQNISLSDQDSFRIDLKKPDDTESTYHFPTRYMRTSFQFEGNRRVDILATTESGEAKFIRIKIGKGGFYLSSDPIAMTNYFMVHPQNHGYISGMLSYLPKEYTVFWDEYYKEGTFRRRTNPNYQPESAWSYLMRQEPLRWGFWVIIIALGLYAIFEAKRTQRIIPIIKPPHNTTLDFTETVGRLYFQQNDHKNVAAKKIKFFLAYIRSNYFLKTHEFTSEFMETLAGKSGIELIEIKKIFHLIDWIGKRNVISEDVLIRLNNYIDNFYKEGAR
jgi:hypothetical protein